MPSEAWAIMLAKLSTKLSTRLSPVPPPAPPSPMVEAAMAGTRLVAALLRPLFSPGKSVPTCTQSIL